MIRSLKILGDFSLAVFNRGLNCCNPDIEALLAIIERAPEENVKYEDVYYQVLGNAIGGMEEEILSKCIAKSQKKISAI